MAIPFLDSLNLNQNELQNSVAQNLATAPSSPKPGQFFFNSTGGVVTIQFWNGAAWVTVDPTKATGIPLANLAGIATATLLGNNSGSTGAPTALTAAQVKALLSIAVADVAGFNAGVQANRLDQMAAPTTAVALNSQRVTGMADPSVAQDAATKNYVDNQVQNGAAGLDPKDAVVAATTANITLSGVQTIDGVAVTAGQRVLVKNQTTASANGIYAVAAGAWTRTTDGSAGELSSGALVLSVGGTTNAGTQWYLQTADPITVGTTSLTWTQFGAGGTYTVNASGGLSLAGSAFSVKTVAGGGVVTDGTGTHVDTAVVALKYATTVGDGSSTSITVTHNLNTRDVIVQLVQAASPYDVVYATVAAATVNTVTLGFATAPASGSLRCVVHG